MRGQLWLTRRFVEQVGKKISPFVVEVEQEAKHVRGGNFGDSEYGGQRARVGVAQRHQRQRRQDRALEYEKHDDVLGRARAPYC